MIDKKFCMQSKSLCTARVYAPCSHRKSVWWSFLLKSCHGTQTPMHVIFVLEKIPRLESNYILDLCEKRAKTLVQSTSYFRKVVTFGSSKRSFLSMLQAFSCDFPVCYLLLQIREEHNRKRSRKNGTKKTPLWVFATSNSHTLCLNLFLPMQAPTIGSVHVYTLNDMKAKFLQEATTIAGFYVLHRSHGMRSI